MRLLRLRSCASLVLLAPLMLLGSAGSGVRPLADGSAAPRDVVVRLIDAACQAPSVRALAGETSGASCATRESLAAHVEARPAIAFARTVATAPAAEGDGTLVGRQRLATIGTVAVDLVAYRSSGLVVGGLFCFVDDGQPRSTVIHLHGGFGGIFVNPDGGDIVGTCYNWAAANGRNAFVPSFRGQDGGEGTQELCLGEADDVAAAALFVRSEAVVDPDRLGLVGASMGACVALRASTRIPNLRAAVAIAPPTDWKAYVAFHRDGFVPTTETRCDGSTLLWDTGGPAYADDVDAMICGHPNCTDAEYAVRSPLPDVVSATNPTLVLSAGADNLVPISQQVLWSVFRNIVGGSVAVDIRDRCAPTSPMPDAQDVFVYVPGAFHVMESGNIVSALSWLSERLDAENPPPGAGL